MRYDAHLARLYRHVLTRHAQRGTAPRPGWESTPLAVLTPATDPGWYARVRDDVHDEPDGLPDCD